MLKISELSLLAQLGTFLIKLFVNFFSAKTKLTEESVGHQFTLVLADDDTEVDDEEYFQTLPDNTVFVLVQRGKRVREKPRSR